jgi:hypothetical protein
MLDVIRYIFSTIFLLLTIYYGIKGFTSALGDLQSIQNHKNSAINFTISVFCALASLELYHPSLAGLICSPILLIGIWSQYLLAAFFLRRK